MKRPNKTDDLQLKSNNKQSCKISLLSHPSPNLFSYLCLYIEFLVTNFTEKSVQQIGFAVYDGHIPKILIRYRKRFRWQKSFLVLGSYDVILHDIPLGEFVVWSLLGPVPYEPVPPVPIDQSNLSSPYDCEYKHSPCSKSQRPGYDEQEDSSEMSPAMQSDLKSHRLVFGIHPPLKHLVELRTKIILRTAREQILYTF